MEIRDRKRKWWIILLAAALCMSVLVGCGPGKTAEKKDVTLIIKAPPLAMNAIADPKMDVAEDFLQAAGDAFAAQYEDANVTVKVRTFEYVNEIQAISDRFDTDDAADILYEGYFNMASYLHSGRVVPLDDIISDELRADVDDALWKMSMADGKTYMMPYLSMQNILIYNKSLFAACGLEGYAKAGRAIQTWSMEEWETILDRLAENLPDGCYPMMMYGKNNQGDTHIMTMMRAFGGEIFDENGNFNCKDEKTVKALTWIQDGIDRGWYPPHPDNLELVDQADLFGSGKLGVFLYNNANIILYDDIDDYGFVNFPGGAATSFVTGFEVFDNGDEAKLAAAKAFIRYIYDTPAWMDLSAGNLPACRSVSERWQDQIVMLDEFMDNQVNVVDFMNNSPNWQGGDTSVRSVFWPNIHDLLAKSVTPQECAEAIDRACNAALEEGRKNSTLHP